MRIDKCSKCGQVIEDGELVIGFDFDLSGGQHINCPKQELAESAKAGQ